VYPYLYGGIDLNIDKVGLMIVQVKNYLNVHGYKFDFREDAFLEMDPFACSMLDDSDKEGRGFPIPIVRILFLSGRDRARTVTSKTYNPPSEGAATLGEDGRLTLHILQLRVFGSQSKGPSTERVVSHRMQ